MVRAIVCLALAMQFCGDNGPELGSDGGPDRAIDSGTDVNPPDAAAVDAGGIGPPEVPEYSAGVDADVATQQCLNNIDENGDGLFDCDDPSCQLFLPLCCIGRSTAQCCTPGTPLATPIASCAAGAIGTCGAITALGAPFGSPSPSIEVFPADTFPTLVLGGGVTDTGLLFSGAVDPRASAVHLDATIAGPSTAHTLGNDFLVFGLTESASADPLIAFYVSGARAEFGLMIAGEIVQRMPLADDGFHRYQLALRPGGAMELRRDEVLSATASLPIDRALRPVIYGRTYNRQASNPLPVRAREASIGTDACDVPSALVSPSAPLALSSGTTWDALTRVAGPSIVRYNDGTADHDRMALEIEGTIYLATRQGEGYVLSSALGAPALIGLETWAEERLADPVLRWNGTALELWFTGWANGQSSIGRVEAAPGGDTFVWGDVDRIFTASENVSFAEPAPFEVDSLPYVIVRVSEGGTDRLVLYRRDTLTAVGTLRTEAPDDLFAFDRDEIGAPSVILAGGAWRLFFAGRRGSRWSIGMLVSVDGVDWREPDLGAFVYDGDQSGFDALGARDPHPAVEDGVLSLYYAGSDGVRTRIGVAEGAVPLRF